MKCAKAYVLEKEQTMIQHEKELDQRALENHIQACANAIKYCETVIDSEFSEMAKNTSSDFSIRRSISVTTDRLGNIHFRTRKYEEYYRTVHHRNGSRSKKRDYDWFTEQDNIDKNTFIQYLNSHCYEVQFTEYSSVIIKPAPEC